VLTSDDDGVTWSKPREITKDVKRSDWTWYATGPGIGIQLKRGAHKGRLVVPCNHRTTGDGAGTPSDGNSHVIFSDDGGTNWQIGGSPEPRLFNESQVVELADGRVMLNMRNSAPGGRKNAARQRGVAISSDGGATFEPARRDDKLIEPICQGSIVRYTWPSDAGKGRIVFSNPASETERVAMTVRVSYDDRTGLRQARRVRDVGDLRAVRRPGRVRGLAEQDTASGPVCVGDHDPARA